MPRPTPPALVDAASRVKTPSGLVAFVFAVLVELWLDWRRDGHAGRRASRQPRRGARAALTRPASGAALARQDKAGDPGLSPPTDTGSRFRPWSR